MNFFFLGGGVLSVLLSIAHGMLGERIVMPTIARYQKGEKAADAARLRLDHGAIAALVVLPTTVQIIANIQHILTDHNKLEESDDGLYRLMDRLAENALSELLARMQASPNPPVQSYNPQPFAMEAAHRALARAGYTMQE